MVEISERWVIDTFEIFEVNVSDFQMKLEQIKLSDFTNDSEKIKFGEFCQKEPSCLSHKPKEAHLETLPRT